VSSPDKETDESRPRTYRAWTGLVFLAISALVVAYLLIDAAVRAGFGQMMLLAPWVLLALWVVYAASAASLLRLDERGVTMQNLLRRISFGWAHVKDVDFRWQLEFSLDDGSKATAMGGPARSRPRRQTARERDVEGVKPPSGVRELADIRRRWKAARQDADAPIRRSWDWPALGALVVIAVWAVVSIAVTR